ncbi:MAG: nicotinate-nucleotide adenylyltransferase [Planctomycetaceae bacterium]|jgi:nicotinate-nucleotide adenylyltransferase
MRLGIFGGTFDPVHYGHLLLAEICRQELALDEVRFVPAGNPPHKSGDISKGHARADMVKLAVSGYPEFTVDRREIRRAGPSFTVLTLDEITQENPNSELFFLMGADSLCDFPTWREPERILELSTVVAVNRPGVEPSVPNGPMTDMGGLDPARILLLSMPGTDISASDLRNRVRDGRGLRFLTPRSVEAFLTEHKLYEESL